MLVYLLYWINPLCANNRLLIYIFRNRVLVMKRLHAIIFDVDGTLADTERYGHRVAFNLAFEDHKLEWHWNEDLYGKLLAVTGGKERIQYFLSNFYDGCRVDGSIRKLITKLHDSKTKHYIELLENNTISLRLGILRLINEIRTAGLRMAIATTTTHQNVTALIKSTLGEHALEWFDYIAAGDTLPVKKKPAPDLFVHC